MDSSLGNKEVMAKNIKYYMNLHDKDRKQICDDLDFKYSTFSEWVNGKKYPRIDAIEKMANYFGIKKSGLIEDRDKFNSKEDELWELRDMLRTRPEMAALFSLSKKATKEDIEKTIKIIETLRGDEFDE